MHYARFKKHGTTDDPRPERHGEKVKHPLWMRHALLKRRGVLCDAWLDFWTFADAVSPQPENSKKLRRLREDLPYGPGNWEWGKTPTPEEKIAYHRAYRDKHPHKRWVRQLRESYDLSPSEYEAMLAAQGGVCAICGGLEKTRNRVIQGNLRKMSVDHDHETGEIRGILCGDCNRGLGMFREEPQRLFAAIQYLAKHKKFPKVS